MNDFMYYTPTKVAFGKESVAKVGELIAEQHCSSVLVHYGSGSVERSGLLARICNQLDEANISYHLLGGVVPNPRLSKVREGMALCQKHQVDFILAVGGGSVLDSAKAIGYGMTNEGELWEFYEKKRFPKACLPIGGVLTIAAAGSEMSNSSVITNDEGDWLKRGCSSDFGRPKFAIMDPTLTMTLPDYQTQCGCVDIMMHTIERYFTQAEPMMLTDGISETLLKTVMENALLLKEDKTNYEARAEIMWAGSLSHNGLTGCGTDGGDWSCHQLEHELSGMFDVAHGAGLAAVFGSWARYVHLYHTARFAQFAKQVFGIERDTTEAAALAGIQAMEAFFQQIDMPISLRELGVTPTEAQYKELALKCSFYGNRTIGVIKKLSQQDMENIYRMAE